MVKRNNKSKKIRIINYSDIKPDVFEENEESNNYDNNFNLNFSDPFFSDFEEIFQRMNNLMENIARQNFSNELNSNRKRDQIFIEPEKEYLEEDEIEENLNINENQDTDAKIVFISQNKLPHNQSWRALGLYVPHMHTIFIADNLPPKVEKFVYFHEVAHSLGIMNEDKADQFATKKCGYYIDLGRRPKRHFCKYYIN